MKRSTGALLLTVAVVAALGGTYAVLSQDDDSPEAKQTTGTTAVERRDLVVTETFDGELGYGDPVPVVTRTGGTVTATREAGAVVRPGERLATVDAEPLMFGLGKRPMYRVLNTDADDGPDVRQLERLLDTLGYADDITVDGSFTAGTRDAVEEWEEDLGRADPDGVVTPDELFFRAEAVRVAEVVAPVGLLVPAGATLLQVTSGEKVVELDLEVDDATALAVGSAVTVTLPDDAEVAAKVSSIGTESVRNPADPGAAATLPVEISFDAPDAAAKFDAGTVEVEVEQSRKEQVLAVPVLALLALAEGGYALELPDGDLVAVEVGTVAEGYAEIEGDVEPGDEVVVPR